MFLAMRYNETKGHWPLMKAKKGISSDTDSTGSEHGTSSRVDSGLEKTDGEVEGAKTTVRSIDP